MTVMPALSQMAMKSADRPAARHAALSGGRIHVIKVGTSTLLTNDEVGGQKANLSNMSRLVEMIASLRKKGEHVVLVSSGAVGMGCLKLGLTEKPKGPGMKQALAAAGQSRLMRLYEDLFQVVGVQVAQLLISRADFSDEGRFLAVRNTCYELLRMGVVPIVNENDSLAAPGLQNFGDNDTMAAMTAVLLQADWVFLATDVNFLYTANPKDDPTAEPIYSVEDVSSLKLAGLESSSSQWGTGGMATKIVAARIAVCAGVHCGLVNGAEPERIGQMIQGDREGGTHFIAAKDAVSAVEDHNRWILTLPSAGNLEINQKGFKAILECRDIFIEMVSASSGNFMQDECVSVLFEGKEVARVLVRMTSEETASALKAIKNPMNNLRDFSAELQAAGVYMKGYNSWRKGSSQGAKGEMNANKMEKLSSNGDGSMPLTGRIIGFSADVALLCTETIKEVAKLDDLSPKSNLDDHSP
eukprot:TRINITY_DN14071_c1_g1_i2.p1 TRINITY_DN14071_c1_g1~~TRINITY_DN14071_c1_g1_i2.p1  ORF type:complete len:470 (+),score=99.80 TRINITY_DN14071_c1_g1_i2:86-1495(+)